MILGLILTLLKSNERPIEINCLWIESFEHNSLQTVEISLVYKMCLFLEGFFKNSFSREKKTEQYQGIRSLVVDPHNSHFFAGSLSIEDDY